MNIGILGIGFHVPKEVRLNSWWPKNVTEKWTSDKERAQVAALQMDTADLPLEIRLLVEAIQQYKDDPFDGSVKRYILAENQNTSDLEIEAGKEALKNAGISPDKIDFVLVSTNLADKLNDSNACLVQKGLNLPNSCYAQDTVGMCNNFLSQLVIAQGLIRSGDMKYGLLIQSSGMSRLVEQTDPMSVLFGDGATAAVVGPVASGEGLLAIESYTEGGFENYLMLGQPGKHWYEGKVTSYFFDPAKGVQVVIFGLNIGKQLIESALKKAKLKKSDVDFFVGHQGAVWFRSVSQKIIGLEHAKAFDTFPEYAGLVASNVLAILYKAQQEKILKKGDIVAAYSPATGFVGFAGLIKWGL